jgi:hypothetical protein
MSSSLPRKVIVAKRGTKRHFARHCESQPIGREYLRLATLRFHSGVSLRVFTVRGGEVS